MGRRVHIIIAEPSAIIRGGVAAILQRIQKLSIEVAEITDITTLSAISLRTTPDLLIINPSYFGQLSMAQLKNDTGNSSLKVIALQSSFADHAMLQSYDSVISLYDSAESIAEKIIEISKVDSEDDESSNKKDLSIREKEIIVCVVKGMTNKSIADTLNLSPHTVIAHRRNIATKLQIHSPSGLTIYAIVNKLVDLSDIKNSISQNKEAE